MNNRVFISPSAKVGITAVALTLVVIIVGIRLGWFSLGSPKGYELIIKFDSTRGLQPGASVLLNGNPIGEVVSTANDANRRPYATVAIRPEHTINTNATAVISAESVLGNKLINIVQAETSTVTAIDTLTPTVEVDAGAVRPGDPVVRFSIEGPRTIGQVQTVGAAEEGRDLATLELTEPLQKSDAVYAGRYSDVSENTLVQVFPALDETGVIQGRREPELTDIVDSVDRTIRIVQDLINDLHPQVTQLLVRVDSILAGVQGMMDESKIDALFADLHTQLGKAGSAVDGISGDIRAMLAESKPMLDSTLANVEATTANVERTTAGIETMVNDPVMRQRLETMLVELEGTSTELHKVMQDIEALTSDDEFTGDIKGTIKAARGTLEKADATLGKISGATGSDGLLGGWEVGGYVQERYQPETDQLYTDVRVEVGKPGKSLFYGGASDIGEGGGVDLGFGSYLSDELRWRAGLRKSKVGIGADAKFEKFGANVDYYDFNDPKLDFFGTYELTETWGVLFGLEDIFDEQGDLASAGVRYQF